MRLIPKWKWRRGGGGVAKRHQGASGTQSKSVGHGVKHYPWERGGLQCDSAYNNRPGHPPSTHTHTHTHTPPPPPPAQAISVIIDALKLKPPAVSELRGSRRSALLSPEQKKAPEQTMTCVPTESHETGPPALWGAERGSVEYNGSVGGVEMV